MIYLILSSGYCTYYYHISSLVRNYSISIGSFAVIAEKVLLWPKDFSLSDESVFGHKELPLGSYANSIYYTIAGTALSVAVTMMAAYALSREFLRQEIREFHFRLYNVLLRRIDSAVHNEQETGPVRYQASADYYQLCFSMEPDGGKNLH